MMMNRLVLLAAILVPSSAGAARAAPYGYGSASRINQASGGNASAARNGQATNGQTVTAVGTVVSVNASAQSFVAHPKDTRYPDFTVLLANNVQFQRSGGTSATFADVVPGAQITAQGTLVSSNAVSATRVTITSTGNSTAVGGANSTTVAGTVTTINASARSFQVQPRSSAAQAITVSVTGGPQVVKSDGSAATLSDIVTGAQVSVQGTSTGNNAVTAQRVLIYSSNNSGRNRSSNGQYGGSSGYQRSTGTGYYGSSAAASYYGSSTTGLTAATTTSTGTTNSGASTTGSTGCQQGNQGNTGTTTSTAANGTSTSAAAFRAGAMRRSFRGR